VESSPFEREENNHDQDSIYTDEVHVDILTKFILTIAIIAVLPAAEVAPCLTTLTGTQGGPSVFNGLEGSGRTLIIR
jgi:hypothetical protein